MPGSAKASERTVPTYRHGRHENGQNFLTHTPTISKLVQLVKAVEGPVVEIGPGDGAITARLAQLGRPLTVVEIDALLCEQLCRDLPTHVRVVNDDFLRYRLPQEAHVLVGNLPFHQTTAMLRRILHAPGWTDAVLIAQWEVARRRAGVGRATMMTTQWAPWFEFSLHGRVPSRAFTPRPSVDGGIFTVHRRASPALPLSQRSQFQGLVNRIYTGQGRGVAEVLSRATSIGSTEEARQRLSGFGIRGDALPGDLPLRAWVDLFKTTGTSPPRRHSSTQARAKKR